MKTLSELAWLDDVWYVGGVLGRKSLSVLVWEKLLIKLSRKETQRKLSKKSKFVMKINFFQFE